MDREGALDSRGMVSSKSFAVRGGEARGRGAVQAGGRGVPSPRECLLRALTTRQCLESNLPGLLSMGEGGPHAYCRGSSCWTHTLSLRSGASLSEKPCWFAPGTTALN